MRRPYETTTREHIEGRADNIFTGNRAFDKMQQIA